MFTKLAGLPTRTKLMSIVVSLLVPMAMLFYFDIASSLTTIRSARSEDFGNDWARPLVHVSRDLVEHRDHVAAVAAGHNEERAEMNEHAGRIQAAIKELDELARENVGGLTKAVDWNSLRATVEAAVGADITSPDNQALHNAAITKALSAIKLVSTISGLSLDPEPDGFALVDANLLQMPSGLQALAQARRDFDVMTSSDSSPRVRVALGEEMGTAKALLTVVFTDLIEHYAAAAPEDTATVEAAESARKSFDELLPRILAAAQGAQLSRDEVRMISERTEELTETLAALQDDGLETLERILNARVRAEQSDLVTHVGVVLLCLALAVAIAVWVTRYLGSQVNKANGVFTRMAEGSFDSVIGAQTGDELGVLLQSLDRMQTDLRSRLESERVVAQANARIRQSLDATSSNVMVTDELNNIIYVNRAAEQMMIAFQEDFRRTVPKFDAAALVGTSFAVFDKDPSHQNGLLSAIRKPFSTELRFGGKTLKIVASPITDDAGNRLGTVIEWVDRTQELAVEAEVQVIVSEALQGNLERRIDMNGKTGFFKPLSAGINELVSSMDKVVSEVRAIVKEANDGNLARRMNLEGQTGLLVRIGSGINDLASNMETVVNEVQSLVNAANDGNLMQRIETEGRSGLLVKVGTGINQLAANMSGIVSQVKSAAFEVSRGADEMSQGNTNLSQRTEEQASSLEETASSMEEMTSTVRQNADNAGQANQLAVAARDQAEKGGAVVARAVKAMEGINEASKKIADIIGVIDEIAFQTNLLALNAAVEAARAGEQGRGFAVVASEVRSLASRSATAAKEIKSLIQDSVQKVDEGSNLVTQSGATLEQIVGAVKKVTDIVAEIAAASQEQSAGIEQVNKAVMQLDELTQQNAALVEEASAASQSMAEQARKLNESMQRYQVDSARASPPEHRTSPAREPVGPVVERRMATRPWTGAKVRATRTVRASGAASAAPASDATANAAAAPAALADDPVWKEF